MADKNKVFNAGQSVRAQGVRSVLEVVEGPNRKGEYLLAMGSMKTWVHGDVISSCPKNPKEQKKKSIHSKLHTEEGISKPPLELDLHGLRVTEAKERLENALDRALMEGRSQLRIIHGYGTGTLKAAVCEYLSNSRHVKAFRTDSQNAAITIAEI